MAELTGYRNVWLMAMFDLPVDTRAGRRAYTQFRKVLVKDGFSMMQYSVYIRHCASEENADVHVGRVQGALPANGEVRVLQVTDKQYERMQVFWGRKRQKTEAPPRQLELF